MCRETTSGLNAGGTSAIPNGYGVEMIGGTSTIGEARRPGPSNIAEGAQRRRSRDVQCRWHDDPGQPGRHESDRHLVHPQRCERISINDVSNTTVGAGGAGAENTIAFNALHGVVVGDATATNNTIRKQIHTNGRLAIDLGADGVVTANDAVDADTGPNNLQNFPVLTSASGGSVRELSPVRRTGSMSSSFLERHV